MNSARKQLLEYIQKAFPNENQDQHEAMVESLLDVARFILDEFIQNNESKNGLTRPKDRDTLKREH